MDDFMADVSRYLADAGGLFEVAFYEESVWWLFFFRLGQLVRKDVRVPILRQLLCLGTRLMHRLMELMTGIIIPLETAVGPGLYIGHGGKIVVNRGAVIGSNCNISTGVVIGESGRGENRGSPVIGDKVYLAPGAKLFGKIRIGDEVVIGANAVVYKDVADKSIVVPAPFQVIGAAGSSEYIQ